MPTIITSVGPGSAYGTTYNIEGGVPVFSRTEQPTWDITGSKTDRSVDVARYIVERGFSVTPQVYEQLKLYLEKYPVEARPQVVTGATQLISQSRQTAEQIAAEKQAKQEALKSEFGGTLTTSGLAVVSTPVGAPTSSLIAESQKELSQAQKKAEYLQASKPFASPEAFKSAVAETSRLVEIPHPSAVVLGSTPEQRAIERGIYEKTGYTLRPEDIGKPEVQKALYELPQSSKDIIGVQETVVQPFEISPKYAPVFEQAKLENIALKKSLAPPAYVYDVKYGQMVHPTLTDRGFIEGMARGTSTALRGIQERVTLPRIGQPQADVVLGAAEMTAQGVISIPLVAPAAFSIVGKWIEEPSKIQESVIGGGKLAIESIKERPWETGLALAVPIGVSRLSGVKVKVPSAKEVTKTLVSPEFMKSEAAEYTPYMRRGTPQELVMEQKPAIVWKEVEPLPLSQVRPDLYRHASAVYEKGTMEGSIEVSNIRMMEGYVSKHAPAKSIAEQKAILSEYFGELKTAKVQEQVSPQLKVQISKQAPVQRSALREIAGTISVLRYEQEAPQVTKQVSKMAPLQVERTVQITPEVPIQLTPTISVPKSVTPTISTTPSETVTRQVERPTITEPTIERPPARAIERVPEPYRPEKPRVPEFRPSSQLEPLIRRKRKVRSKIKPFGEFAKIATTSQVLGKRKGKYKASSIFKPKKR